MKLLSRKNKSKTKMLPLGELLKEARLRKLLSQAEVARNLDVTPQYISNIECGRCKPPISILGDLIRIYGFPKKKIIHILLKNHEQDYLNRL